jgi:hypothetical protein
VRIQQGKREQRSDTDENLQGPTSQPESKPAADEPSLADMAGDCLQRVGRAQAIARMVADAHPEESHDERNAICACSIASHAIMVVSSWHASGSQAAVSLIPPQRSSRPCRAVRPASRRQGQADGGWPPHASLPQAGR